MNWGKYRVLQFAAIAAITISGLLPAASHAQAPGTVVPVIADPEHRVRFDNGKVRMYEILLPKDKSTMWHEHSADNFQVVINTTEVVAEAQGKKPVNIPIRAGMVGFTSTAKGSYVHRVEGGGDTPFRVLAIELLGARPPAAGADAAKRPSPAFTVALENARGRAYRIVLEPGESTGTFTRPSNTAIFAISSGRISELGEDRAPRLWDFDPANFRWSQSPETLSLKNEGTARIELVELEIY